ncbi:MAG TPA: hypothetical protein VGT44_20230 [Ktedonobacteraceae bacterium]|nr:hypothetical protein [Ktedonobacteraceae bacterium]
MRAIRAHFKYGFGLVIIVISLFMAGCASQNTPQMVKRSTQTPPHGLEPSTWQSIPLPRLDLELLAYVVSPVDPATIYACTSNGSSQAQNRIALWRTQDTGQHWSSLHLPASPGTGCQLSLIPTQPPRLAVLVTNPYGNLRPCDNDSLYLSDDGGNSLQHVPYSSIAPEGAQTVFCQVMMSSHYLYLYYSFDDRGNALQMSLLERTGDMGVTWTRIDTTFGANALFLPPQVGAKDSLAVIVRHLPLAVKDEPVLWTSLDGGASWKRVGTLPDQIGTFLLAPPSANTSWLTATTPFYALAEEQIPSNLYRLRVFESGNGQQWSPTPPLPVPGASTTQPGLLQALAVFADGRLFAFGVNPKNGLSGSASTQRKTSAFWLWMWNPHSSRWQVLPTPLNYLADESCGLCWNAQASSSSNQANNLYVYQPDTHGSFFRVLLPSS